MLQSGRRTASGLLRLLYPPACAGCGAVMDAGHAVPVCLSCLAGFTRADPVEAAAELAHLPGAEAIRFVFPLWEVYRSAALQNVHHLLKYGNRPLYGIQLGHHLGVEFMDAAPDPAPDFIVPVPLHRARLYERGYNQSALLARGISEVTGLPVREDLLVRARPTRSQTQLTRERRWRNVSGAFAAPVPQGVHGLHLLLVDDILTTGATLLAAAAALQQAGPASLAIATLAKSSQRSVLSGQFSAVSYGKTPFC